MLYGKCKYLVENVYNIKKVRVVVDYEKQEKVIEEYDKY